MVTQGEGWRGGIDWEFRIDVYTLLYLKQITRGPSRWWRNNTWGSPSSPQIHQKYIYMWNNSYRTPTECWQKTSDIPKVKKLPRYLGRAKEKRKNREKRIRMGPASLGGSCEGRNMSTHEEAPSLVETGGGRGGRFRVTEESAATECRGQSREIPTQRIGADQHSPA